MVNIRYIDVQDSAEVAKHPVVESILKERQGTSLPLVAFDGVPLWMGSLSYPYLVEELSKRGVKPVA